MPEGWVTAASVLRDVALAVTAGSLAFAAVVAPRGSHAARRALALAWVAAVAWAVSMGAYAIVSYSFISGTPVSSPSFGEELWSFLTTVGLGQVYLQALIAALLVSVAAGLARTPAHAAWSLLPVGWALVVLSLTGHAAGSADHHLATSAMFLHLAGASVWLGLIAALVAARPRAGDASAGARDLALRTSRAALAAVVLVAVSGIVNSWLRLGSPADLLTTRYGLLLTVKIALTGVVVVFAAWARRRWLERLDDAAVAARFWRLLAAEAGVFLIIMSVAAVLSATAPPAPIVTVSDPSPAWLLTGYELPPAPTAMQWVAQWRFELVAALACAVAVAAYLRWVRRLARRGDRWPWHRTALWLLGIAMMLWATQGAPAVYGSVTFSGHMLQHMLLAMAIPLPLTLAAPVTLALRALPQRQDESRGPREWVRALVESRMVRVLANPVVAAVNFAGSMVVFYYTPVFRWVLENHVGHLWMIAHFTLAGYFFANALVGVDPGVRRPAYPVRLILLFATMAFHAFFGVALMSSTALLVPRWFGLMGRPWGPDALADQQVGGQIAWGIGEIPVLVLAIAVVVMWRRDDERATRRLDRRADRDGDAELRRYNEMLARMAHRDQS